MIVKGASRSGPQQLAVYLMRVERYDTGEPAELLQLDSIWSIGVEADDRERTAAQLVEAFRDWQSAVELTKQGRDGLYHLEISPAPEYAGKMTREEWLRSADLAGEELGLDGQNRAVVLHGGKDGRLHLHVVWQRTDVEKMKVISDAYNYVGHERASHRMELEFGHDFVPGKHAKRDRKKQPEFPREKLSQDEDQYQKRTGLQKEGRVTEIMALRAAAENGPAFKAALEDAGYVLAKGDRGYVVVDSKGGQSVLTRNVGLKKKELEAFMAGVELAKLPTVQEAKALQAERRRAAKKEAPSEKPKADLSAEALAKVEEAAPEKSEREELKKLKDDLTAIKASADSAQAFKSALEETGFILAKGERGYTLVDNDGTIHSLARQLKMRKADIEAYMAPVSLDTLPTVEQAQQLQAERRQAAEAAPEQPKEKGVEASKFLPPQEAPKQPEAPQPQVDAELEKLKKDLAKRQADEMHKWAEYHAQQVRQLEFELDKLFAQKSADFDAIQQQERDALKARHAEKRKGIKGIMEAIENRWNPALAAEKAKERRREVAQLKRRQDQERKDYLALLEQNRQLEIENLKERQALRLQDEQRKHNEERERYIRDHEAAKRLREQIIADQLKEELERNESLRDGPPPPKLGK